MYTPQVPQPKTSAGGNKSIGSGDAKVKTREPVPFMYNKQDDTVESVSCPVCDAPLHVYEKKEHTVACEAIAASDGKDKEFPQEPDDDEEPVGIPDA